MNKFKISKRQYKKSKKQNKKKRKFKIKNPKMTMTMTKMKINCLFRCKKLWDSLNLVPPKDNNIMVQKEFLKQKIKEENIDNI